MDYGIAVSSTTCIVYGISYNYEATPNSIGFIKAFDTTTGNLKWERTLTIGPRNNYILSIIIDGNIAYIKTGIDNILGPNYNEDFLGAYNINTGQSIWEKKTSTNISHSRDPLQYMALVNNRLIQVTAKWQENVFPPTYHNILVQAYQAKEIVVMPSNSLLLQQ
jgi:outer membrane protein assembly factor BamB